MLNEKEIHVCILFKMAARCARCLHALRKYQVITQKISKIKSRKCVTAHGKVPQNVLKSKANDFSGERIELFEAPEVQDILKRLTGLNLDKVFIPRKESLQNPVYKVLAKEEFEQVRH